MNWAMALSLLASAHAADREPGAPWVRFTAPGNNPVYVDPTSLHDEGGEKVIRMLDTAETSATSDIWIDISFDCAAKRGWIIRLTAVKDGTAAEVNDIAEADRKPLGLDDPLGRRLFDFACAGKPL